MKNYLKAFLAVGAFLFASVGLAADTTESPIINSEDFEGLTADTTLTIDDTDWSYSGDTSEEGFATVKAYSDKEEPVDPPKKDDTSIGGNNYLKLETSAPLYRNVSNADATDPSFISGLYFEGDVQFSPYEEDVALTKTNGTSALDPGTKLLVYIKGTEKTDEAEAATNFVIVAGYYNGRNGVVTTNYVCNAPKEFNYDKDAWHHLLIKAVVLTKEDDTGNKTYYPYFKVLVDNTALTSTEAKGAETSVMANIGADAFPSLDVNKSTTLSGVGFQGTGKVDNLVWTTVDSKPETKRYKFVWTDGEGTPTVTTNTVSIGTVVNGQEYKFAEGIKVDWKFKPAEDRAIENESPEGVVDGTLTTVEFVTTSATVQLIYTSGEETVIEPFADFASAVARANELGVAITVKLLANAEMGSDDSVVFYDSSTASSYDVVIILNGFTLTVPGGLAAYASLTIVDKSKDSVTDTGCIVLKNASFYAVTMTIYGGKFDTLPMITATVPEGYELTSKADSEGWYYLKKSGGSGTITPSDVSGGDVTVDGTTITVNSSDSGEITINGDASEYTISVPQNVTTITGTVNKDKITIMGKSEGMTAAVNITGAFSVTTKDNETTIALDPDGKVTVNGVEVSVTPELDTTEGAEPFAVGDSVSATVKAIPGLTYSLLSSTDVSTVKTSTTSECDKTADASGTVTLEDKNTDKPAAKFYVIKVSR